MVQGQRKQNWVAEITAGGHQIISDVSPKLGGTDLGMNPHELLESALTACTIITVQMYADRKTWPLQSMKVKVSIDKEGPESHILREITLMGPLTDEQKARLYEIADKCPIHKLLTGKIEVSTLRIDG